MNKEISLKNFLIVVGVLALIEILIMVVIIPGSKNRAYEKEKKEHCPKAVCNEDQTICYNYGLGDNDQTIVTWKGSCK